MFEFNKSKNQIEIKSNPYFLGIGIVVVFMGVMAVRLIFGILPSEEDYTFADVLGLLFVCAFLVLLLTMGIFSLRASLNKIIINDEGIQNKTWLSKRKLSWLEVEDWGISYCGQTRWEGNTYYFYFSKNQHPIKNECTKKLRGKMIKIFVIGDDYAEFTNTVIPFCSQRTTVKPFIGKDTYHFM